MLPVLATIANEAVKWPSPQAGFLQEHWWAGGDAFVHMRRNESPPTPQGAPRDHPLSDERAGRRSDGPSAADAGLG